eukprot:SAG11_NODE_185_length_13160_cov_9.118521_14_plen_116_part_00
MDKHTLHINDALQRQPFCFAVQHFALARSRHIEHVRPFIFVVLVEAVGFVVTALVVGLAVVLAEFAPLSAPAAVVSIAVTVTVTVVSAPIPVSVSAVVTVVGGLELGRRRHCRSA